MSQRIFVCKPGDRFDAWLDPRLEMRPSAIGGRGCFALQAVEAGEVVMKWGGTVFSRTDILAGKVNPETIAVLDEDLYLADPLGETPAGDYALNHACDPNLWMRDALSLCARRPIAPGEELTADYALWLYEQDWTLNPCRCGSPLCRGAVTSHDWLRPELQTRYAGHFTPYLNRLIGLPIVQSGYHRDKRSHRRGSASSW